MASGGEGKVGLVCQAVLEAAVARARALHAARRCRRQNADTLTHLSTTCDHHLHIATMTSSHRYQEGCEAERRQLRHRGREEQVEQRRHFGCV